MLLEMHAEVAACSFCVLPLHMLFCQRGHKCRFRSHHSGTSAGSSEGRPLSHTELMELNMTTALSGRLLGILGYNFINIEI